MKELSDIARPRFEPRFYRSVANRARDDEAPVLICRDSVCDEQISK